MVELQREVLVVMEYVFRPCRYLKAVVIAYIWIATPEMLNSEK